MFFDLHTHSFLSDGNLSPVELFRRAAVRGLTAVAITDHVGPGELETTLRQLHLDCEVVSRHWPLAAVPGVELTHVPPAAIPEVARRAKQLGARIVVVHGETPVEPVAEGTNEAAIRCPDVDILAHPGLISEELAAAAARSGVYLELSARKGHCLANGHVAALAAKVQASLVVNSDAHAPEDLLTPELARKVALGAGLTEAQARSALADNPRLLLSKAGISMPSE